jgi:polysaccharide deacetylase 2 family uncharacterized protein YibQ
VRLFAVFALLLSAISNADPTARIAIIIDDLGYQLEAGERAIRLPGPVAYAVLPETPRGRSLAVSAHQSGKEVLLHLPLQAVDNSSPPEPGSITMDMSREAVAAALDRALDSVPHAIGVNGHRGSLLTRHPGHKRWLMEELVDREGLFFVDSFTTHASVALQIAGEMQISAIRRDVFLDNDDDTAAIAGEFERLKRLARQRGIAVAIGHPYPATLAFLETELPKLSAQGFELVTISSVISEAGDPPGPLEIATSLAADNENGVELMPAHQL